MLNTSEAKFHIRLIPSRWYQKGKNGLHKPFIIADKFNNSIISSSHEVNNLIAYLCAIDKEKDNLIEQRMGILDQKVIYSTLYKIYSIKRFCKKLCKIKQIHYVQLKF
jgi:hypothetical protein